MDNKKKILFVCPYPFDEAPSQRFRFEQYLKHLEKEGIIYKIAPFLNLKAWQILYKSGNSFKKGIWLALSFIKRFILLLRLNRYDYIFVHREATPIGPPFFEWTCWFFWKKRIIYDFDDAIWLEDPSEKGTLKAALKWKSKVNSICKWSYKISCGNQYLADYAKYYNDKVVLNPTTIDTDYHKNMKSVDSDKIIIGWTGTHSTLPYLKIVLPVLTELSQKYEFTLMVISNEKPDFNIPFLRFVRWQKFTEIEDLNKIDIGIMPLTNDIWSQGKCGFKLLQYMAVKKPILASPVGVNEKLLLESTAGYAATSNHEWKKRLEQLLNDSELRMHLGNKGREYVQNNYSVDSNKTRFLSLIQ